jgi:hypothetical protein
MIKKILFFTFSFLTNYTMGLNCYTISDVTNSNNLYYYDGNVYTTSNYKHPGGSSTLSRTIGNDLSIFVNTPKYDFHLNSNKFKNDLKNYLVGTLQNTCENLSTATSTTTTTTTTTSTSKDTISSSTISPSTQPTTTTPLDTSSPTNTTPSITTITTQDITNIITSTSSQITTQSFTAREVVSLTFDYHASSSSKINTGYITLIIFLLLTVIM